MGEKVFAAYAQPGAQGEPSVKRCTLLELDGRIMERTLEVSTPEVIDVYNAAENTMDVSNLLRKGQFALLRSWRIDLQKPQLLQADIDLKHVNAFLAFPCE